MDSFINVIALLILHADIKVNSEKSQTSQLRILYSADEDNLGPFDSKIDCLCQSIKINNSKHV